MTERACHAFCTAERKEFSHLVVLSSTSMSTYPCTKYMYPIDYIYPSPRFAEQKTSTAWKKTNERNGWCRRPCTQNKTVPSPKNDELWKCVLLLSLSSAFPLKHAIHHFASARCTDVIITFDSLSANTVFAKLFAQALSFTISCTPPPIRTATPLCFLTSSRSSTGSNRYCSRHRERVCSCATVHQHRIARG